MRKMKCIVHVNTMEIEMKMKTTQLPCLIYYSRFIHSINPIENLEFDWNLLQKPQSKSISWNITNCNCICILKH